MHKDAMKAEKHLLLEEGCAMILQGAWKCKKAYRRAQGLKLEKQRKLEEAAACMLQGVWRCKKAYGMVGEKKGQKGAAAKLQATLRGKNARREYANKKRAALLFQNLVRKQQARGLVSAAGRLMARPWMVTVHAGHGLRAADSGGVSDPFFQVSVVAGENEEVAEPGEHMYFFKVGY